jgi:hypothetical protein
MPPTTRPDRTDTGRTDRTGSVWSSPSFLAALVVVLVLIAAAVAAVVNHHGGNAPVAVPTATPTASSSSGPTAPAPALVDTAIPTAAPVTAWADYHGVLIPTSATAGPARVTGDVASGFAHSPTGALLAATQLPVRRILAADWSTVLTRSVVPGPGVAVWRSTRSQLGTEITPPAGGWTQTAGYRFLAYNPDQAVIQFLNSASTGDFTVTVTTVSWNGGDWKLVLQPDGDDTPTTTPVTSPAGYTIWQGTR